MEDLDLLKKPNEIIKLGGREIQIEEMTAGKALRAVEKYQKAFDILRKEGRNVIEKTRIGKRYQNRIIDVCIFILRPSFSFENMKIWASNKAISKKWLYNNATLEQLTKFIEKVLKPILPDDTKKKIEAIEAAIKQ